MSSMLSWSLRLENELCSELAYLEQRKKELEEQINAVKSNISASQAARNMASQRKREIFGEAKILKAQRDGRKKKEKKGNSQSKSGRKKKLSIKDRKKTEETCRKVFRPTISEQYRIVTK